MSPTRIKTLLPWLAALLVVCGAALQLRLQGRSWFCSCGNFRLWLAEAWSSETSQQLFDPYSFTHVLHGLAFYGLLAVVVPKLATRWRFVLAILMESLWEAIENTNLVIQRYRDMTAALGYEGDTIVNSLGDILACGFGFWMARALGWRRSLVLLILIETVLLVAIRDSMVLNILMLIYQFDGIKAWQSGN